VDGLGHTAAVSQDIDAAANMLSVSAMGASRVGLIDGLTLTRDCLSLAFSTASPDLIILPFTTAEECIRATAAGIGIILYHSHEYLTPRGSVLRAVKLLCEKLPHIPVAVLSSHAWKEDPHQLRAVLSAGARGFIPSAGMSIQPAIAAMRLVMDGGSFAPADLVAGIKRSCGEAAVPARTKLTLRENEVLSRLRHGQSNKIIAYELGMSESTVKVHARNIMRKMGATNRTQAVYKSQQLWRDAGVEP
jgi:DNA-binding NarL/FixJ family response regulator